MEEMAKNIVHLLSNIVEMVAALVIAVALLQFLYTYLKSRFQQGQHVSNTYIRITFGSSLAIALELLLAADILETAVAPTWDDIGKLAAIAAVRTFLNYFLEKELKNIEQRSNSINKPNQVA